MSRTEYSQKKHWARRNKTAGLLAFLFCLFLPPSAHAQQARHETLQEKYAARAQNVEDKNYVSFSFENDSIGTGTDRFYSSGERLSWFNVNTPVPPVIDRLADIIPTFDLNETTSTLFTLGQNIYTPEDIRIDRVLFRRVQRAFEGDAGSCGRFGSGALCFAAGARLCRARSICPMASSASLTSAEIASVSDKSAAKT